MEKEVNAISSKGRCGRIFRFIVIVLFVLSALGGGYKYFEMNSEFA